MESILEGKLSVEKERKKKSQNWNITVFIKTKNTDADADILICNGNDMRILCGHTDWGNQIVEAWPYGYLNSMNSERENEHFRMLYSNAVFNDFI